MGRVTDRRKVRRIEGVGRGDRSETLVVEEPLEIRVNGQAVAVTMRTPGSDVELTQGFLLTEGVIASRDDLLTVRYCQGEGPDGLNTYNVLDVALAPGVAAPDPTVTRNFYTTSSCGVCGKGSLDVVRTISRFSPVTTRPPSDRTRWPACRTNFARDKRFSRRPAGYMRPRCSPWMGPC